MLRVKLNYLYDVVSVFFLAFLGLVTFDSVADVIGTTVKALFFLMCVSVSAYYILKKLSAYFSTVFLVVVFSLFYVLLATITASNTERVLDQLFNVGGGVLPFFIAGVAFREILIKNLSHQEALNRTINNLNERVVLKKKKNGLMKTMGVILLLTAPTTFYAASFLFGYDAYSARFISEKGLSGYQPFGNWVPLYLLACIVFSIKKLKNATLRNAIVFYLGFVLALLAQFFGSNNAFVMIVFIVFFYIFSTTVSRQLHFKKSKFLTVALRTSLYFSISIFIITVLSLGAMELLNIDPHSLRIFGFSQDSYGASSDSLGNRIELLRSNLEQQLAIAGIFGDVDVDITASQTGEYIHSSLISVFLSLGIAGFVLFVLIFYFGAKNITKMRAGFHPDDSVVKLTIVSLFYTYLLISAVATFFSWGPVWFFLGIAGSKDFASYTKSRSLN